jgi:hypothetical protein
VTEPEDWTIEFVRIDGEGATFRIKGYDCDVHKVGTELVRRYFELPKVEARIEKALELSDRVPSNSDLVAVMVSILRGEEDEEEPEEHWLDLD